MKKTVADDWTSQLAFLEEYDNTFGIFDHERNGDADPLAIIGMHPAEDVVTGSAKRLLMRQLIACRIPEITHTPILELMNFPRYELEEFIREGKAARNKEEAGFEEIQEQIRKQNMGG